VSSRARIVATLHAAGDFVSGEDLASEVGVSRTAIWKQISALEEQGFVIERARGRGYRLTATPGGLTEGEIASTLLTEWLGRSLVCKALTGSTNSDASALGRAGAPEHRSREREIADGVGSVGDAVADRADALVRPGLDATFVEGALRRGQALAQGKASATEQAPAG